MENEFNKKLQLWLHEVATTCDIYAKEIDLDFYPFQSPIPKSNVELLIVAINPGSSKSYKEMLEEKSKDYGKVIEGRTRDMLDYDVNMYAEKPQWEIDNKLKGNDVMRTKLRRVFVSKQLQNLLKDSAIINLYYFNTRDTKLLWKLSNTIKEFCEKKTFEFIEIANPRKILFFTTDNYMLSKCGVQSMSIKSIGHYVKEGILKNGQKVLALPNPGFYKAYSYDNGQQMGNLIEKYINS
jgi:hypothetical protein